MIELICGDCLEKMKDITDGSIDLILTDPPYSTTELKWDTMVDFIGVASKKLSHYGVCVVFNQPPLTGVLHNYKGIKHLYDIVWIKNKTSRFLDAKYRPMSRYENISLLGRYSPCNANVGKFTYNPQGIVSKGIKKIAHKGVSTCCTSRGNYEGKMVESFTGYPSNVLNFDIVGNSSRLHPTQKPVKLLEYLIKTYSNEGDTILDPFTGSGSTGVACKNLNRNFIGIELDENYFNIAKKRIEETL